MKLIIAIIQDDYVRNVIYDLTDHNIRATKLTSTGGFLKSGNTTLLVGIDESKLDLVVDIIRDNCGSTSVTKDGEDIEVSGANLFVLDMDRYLRI